MHSTEKTLPRSKKREEVALAELLSVLPYNLTSIVYLCNILVRQTGILHSIFSLGSLAFDPTVMEKL